MDLQQAQTLPLRKAAGTRRGPAKGFVAVALVAVLLGFAVRIALSAISLGTSDWFTWHSFGYCVLGEGLFHPYELDHNLNHPPLPTLWSALCASTTYLGAFVVHDEVSCNWLFAFLFRIPCILADAGAAFLLYRIWSEKTGRTGWGWVAAAAMAWNLETIMVGAYHCNTDNLCAFFTLLSAYFLAAPRRGYFAGGLSLAAAINVKIVPLVLIPALFSTCRSPRDAIRFIAAMALGSLPFVMMFAVIPETFAHNVFGYNSAGGPWGLIFIFLAAPSLPLLHDRVGAVSDWFFHYGKFALLAIEGLLGVAGAWLRRWDAYELGALSWALFLIFTPGFGFQYAVYVAPLLLAANLRSGVMYGLAAGLFSLTAYAGSWMGTLPLESYPTGQPNPLPVPIGLIAWAVLIDFVCRTLWRRRPLGIAAKMSAVVNEAIPQAQIIDYTPAGGEIGIGSAAAVAG